MHVIIHGALTSEMSQFLNPTKHSAKKTLIYFIQENECAGIWLFQWCRSNTGLLLNSKISESFPVFFTILQLLPLDSTEHLSVTSPVQRSFVLSFTRLHTPLGAFQKRSAEPVWFCWLAQCLFCHFPWFLSFYHVRVWLRSEMVCFVWNIDAESAQVVLF